MDVSPPHRPFSFYFPKEWRTEQKSDTLFFPSQPKITLLKGTFSPPFSESCRRPLVMAPAISFSRLQPIEFFLFLYFLKLIYDGPWISDLTCSPPFLSKLLPTYMRLPFYPYFLGEDMGLPIVPPLKCPLPSPRMGFPLQLFSRFNHSNSFLPPCNKEDFLD